MYVNTAFDHEDSGDSRTDDNDTLGVPAAWLKTKISRPKVGGRRHHERLREAGKALASVLAAAALTKVCEWERCTTAAGSQPYATTAEVAALNNTLVSATVDVIGRLSSVEVWATRLCDAFYESKAVSVHGEGAGGGHEWRSRLGGLRTERRHLPRRGQSPSR
jgi:hypothetical protein